MKFGSIPLEQASGAILAHSLRVADGSLKKGRVLADADLERLRSAGFDSVVAARLEPGDVPEDEAAARLAAALAGDAVRVASPFTGRCNLFARADGLMQLDADRVRRVNRVHESLTVATLRDGVGVTQRQMLATVKVIPFAAPCAALAQAEAIALDGPPALRIAAYAPLAAALIQTRLAGTRDSVLDKTVRVLTARLEAIGGSLAGEQRCAHERDAVAAALAAALQSGAGLVLVAGASAIVDRRDVVPAAIVAAGGELIHFGMPVDPGNLLLVARHGRIPVIGLPGCARSPKYNGFDQVLERVAAGMLPDREALSALAVGGLLSEIVERPQPRAGSAARAPARAPRIGALVLAAGQSRRMGGVNKLLLEVDGEPMVARVVGALAASAVDEVVVVTGHERERVRAALTGRTVRFVHNPHFRGGLSTSLARGLGALDARTDAVLVCLGDMPRVSAAIVDRLIAAYDPLEGRAICVPTYRGKRGNPVLWDRRFFESMRQVRGDVGARHLIGEHPDALCEVAMDDSGVLLDLDSPQALAALPPLAR